MADPMEILRRLRVTVSRAIMGPLSRRHSVMPLSWAAGPRDGGLAARHRRPWHIPAGDRAASPISLRAPLHNPCAGAEREPAGRLLGNRFPLP